MCIRDRVISLLTIKANMNTDDQDKRFQAVLARIKIYPLSKLKEEINFTPELMKAVDEDGRTLFFWACAEGRQEIVEHFFSLGSDINHRDEANWTPLHIAASLGRANTVKFLLLNGANANALTLGKQTPLHYAASKGKAQVCE
eukprot:TRINITY_DN8190_c0_g1_i19.p1 TRINITY_DN8190_c0_g1~~TRINITY_DN8190_c0_g1_i19.p1  ORF type:complete len:143 (-),score=24.96 TRINITY_DN8190_c0_g1_i19:478-906(-)